MAAAAKGIQGVGCMQHPGSTPHAACSAVSSLHTMGYMYPVLVLGPGTCSMQTGPSVAGAPRWISPGLAPGRLRDSHGAWGQMSSTALV